MHRLQIVEDLLKYIIDSAEFIIWLDAYRKKKEKTLKLKLTDGVGQHILVLLLKGFFFITDF